MAADKNLLPYPPSTDNWGYTSCGKFHLAFGFIGNAPLCNDSGPYTPEFYTGTSQQIILFHPKF